MLSSPPYWLSNADIRDLWPPFVLQQLFPHSEYYFHLNSQLFCFFLNPRSSWNTTKHFILFLLSSISAFLWCLSALPLFPPLLCFFSVVGANQKKGLCLFSQFWMSIKEVLAREIRIEKEMLLISTSEETIVLPWRWKSAIEQTHPHRDLCLTTSFVSPPTLVPGFKSKITTLWIINTGSHASPSLPVVWQHVISTNSSFIHSTAKDWPFVKGKDSAT